MAPGGKKKTAPKEQIFNEENDAVHETMALLQKDPMKPTKEEIDAMEAGGGGAGKEVVIKKDSVKPEEKPKAPESDESSIFVQLMVVALFVAADVGKNCVENVATKGKMINSSWYATFLSFLSIIFGIGFTYVKQGSEGLGKIFDMGKIINFALPAVCFSIQANLMCLGNLFLSATLKKVLSQVRIPLTALATKYIMGQTYSGLQWMVIVMITVSVWMFVVVVEGGGPVLGGGDPMLPVGLLVALFANLAAVVGTLMSEKFLKKDKKMSFYIQMTQIQFTQFLIGLLCFLALTPFGIGGACVPILDLMKYDKPWKIWDSQNPYVTKSFIQYAATSGSYPFSGTYSGYKTMADEEKKELMRLNFEKYVEVYPKLMAVGSDITKGELNAPNAADAAPSEPKPASEEVFALDKKVETIKLYRNVTKALETMKTNIIAGVAKSDKKTDGGFVEPSADEKVFAWSFRNEENKKKTDDELKKQFTFFGSFYDFDEMIELKAFLAKEVERYISESSGEPTVTYDQYRGSYVVTFDKSSNEFTFTEGKDKTLTKEEEKTMQLVKRANKEMWLKEAKTFIREQMYKEFKAIADWATDKKIVVKSWSLVVKAEEETPDTYTAEKLLNANLKKDTDSDINDIVKYSFAAQYFVYSYVAAAGQAGKLAGSGAGFIGSGYNKENKITPAAFPFVKIPVSQDAAFAKSDFDKGFVFSSANMEKLTGLDKEKHYIHLMHGAKFTKSAGGKFMTAPTTMKIDNDGTPMKISFIFQVNKEEKRIDMLIKKEGEEFYTLKESVLQCYEEAGKEEKFDFTTYYNGKTPEIKLLDRCEARANLHKEEGNSPITFMYASIQPGKYGAGMVDGGNFVCDHRCDTKFIVNDDYKWIGSFAASDKAIYNPMAVYKDADRIEKDVSRYAFVQSAGFFDQDYITFGFLNSFVGFFDSPLLLIAIISNILATWMSGLLTKVLSSLWKTICSAVCFVLICSADYVLVYDNKKLAKIDGMNFAVGLVGVVLSAIVFSQVPKPAKKH